MADSCFSSGDVAGIAIGVLIGTFALVGIIIGLYLYCRRKNKPKNQGNASASGDRTKGSYDNPTFSQDEVDTSKAAEKTTQLDHAEKGFGGYVQCEEYESANKQGS